MGRNPPAGHALSPGPGLQGLHFPAVQDPRSPPQGQHPQGTEKGPVLLTAGGRGVSGSGTAPPPPNDLAPLSRCLWAGEEPSLSYSGGISRHPSPAGQSQSHLCDPRPGTHPLWSGPGQWPWLHQVVASPGVEGCVWGSHAVRQTPSPGARLQGAWHLWRKQPPVGVWGTPSLLPRDGVLGKPPASPGCGAGQLDFPTWQL